MVYLIILILLEVVFFAFAYFFSHKDIMSPSVVMVIMFLASTGFAAGNLKKWQSDFSFEALMIISSGLFVFILTDVLIANASLKKGVRTSEQSITYTNNTGVIEALNIKTIAVLFWILFDCITVYLYYRQVHRIVGGNFSSFASIIAQYRRIGIAELAGGNSTSISGIINQLNRFVIASGYASAFILINNKISKKKKELKNIGLVIIIVLSLMPSIIVASRGQILKFICACGIEWYILWQIKNGWRKSPSFKLIRWGILIIAAGVPAFYYSLNLIGRAGGLKLNLLEYTSLFLGGSIVLFSKYIADPVPTVLVGEESLTSILKIFSSFGLIDKTNSYNLEFRKLGVSSSNVYTFFRRPFHDFGLIGMYIFVICIAVVMCSIYHKRIKYEVKSSRLNRWIMLYGYLFYWIFVSSILQYSVNLISAGTVLIMICIYFVFFTITNNTIKIKV